MIFAVRQPDPNYQLLDRFLITMEQQGIPSIICFNKKDLAEQEELDQMYQIYISCGYQVLLTSAEQEEGISRSVRFWKEKQQWLQDHPVWEIIVDKSLTGRSQHGDRRDQ